MAPSLPVTVHDLPVLSLRTQLHRCREHAAQPFERGGDMRDAVGERLPHQALKAQENNVRVLTTTAVTVFPSALIAGISGMNLLAGRLPTSSGADRLSWSPWLGRVDLCRGFFGGAREANRMGQWF